MCSWDDTWMVARRELEKAGVEQPTDATIEAAVALGTTHGTV